MFFRTPVCLCFWGTVLESFFVTLFEQVVGAKNGPREAEKARSGFQGDKTRYQSRETCDWPEILYICIQKMGCPSGRFLAPWAPFGVKNNETPKKGVF